MRPFIRQLGTVYSRRWIALQLIILFGLTGCDLMGNNAPPPDNQLHIERIAKWYQLYRADNRGRAPKDEDQFMKYIEKQLQGRGETLDREEFLTSPRDGQKYIVNYGKPTTRNLEKNVAVREQEGYKGKKWVAFEAAWAMEVDEAKLQSLLAGEEQ